MDEEQREEFEVDDFLDTKEFVSEILETVKEFSEEEKELFSLRYLQGLSYREIALIMDKTEVSLRVSAHRIIKKIKEIYHD